MITLPAPIWRRFAAAFYDGLLLLGVWLVALIVDMAVRGALGLPRDWTQLRAYLFIVGMTFFGWFWTHGGQTLGMRAWHLHVIRADAQPLRWLDAAMRYALMLLCWAIVLTPALSRLPQVTAVNHPYALSVGVGCAIATVLTLISMRMDGERRGPQDWLSRTRVVQRVAAAPPN